MIQQQEDKGKKVTLQWSGDLTVRRIAELKAEVQAALTAATSLSITMAPDAVCDISLLQLLCAAHRTASAQGKLLSLCGDLPEQFSMVLKLAGFSRHIGCVQDLCGSCLWKLIYQQSKGQGNHRVEASTGLSI